MANGDDLVGSGLPSGRFVELPSGRFRYLVWGAERGDASAIVLLHSNADSAASWARVGPSLADLGQVFALDLRGHGYSVRKPLGGYGLRPAADDVLDFFTALGITRPVLMGHSWGAAIALVLATGWESNVAAPELSGLVFEELPASITPRGWQSWVSAVTRAGALDDERLRPILEAVNPDWHRVDIASQLAGLSRTDGQVVADVLREGPRSGPLLPLLAHLRVPALLLRAVAPGSGALTASDWESACALLPAGAAVHEFPGSTHDIHRARFEDFVGVVRDFVRLSPSPAPSAPFLTVEPRPNRESSVSESDSSRPIGESVGDVPIAIVGMACRVPGAASTEQFWKLLVDGVDTVREVPADRFDVDAYYDERPATAGRTVNRHGGFLTGVDQFDAQFFGVSKREAVLMDPQQRLLLETSFEAIQDAGWTADELAGSLTGVYVGQTNTDYWDLQCGDPTKLELYALTGAARSVQSGRISFAWDLRGPSLSVDSACSSSLSSVHLACEALRNGSCTAALACGAHLVLIPHEAIAYSQAGMLSADGRCKFGDSSADGFTRAECVGVAALKPLARALADGDPVRAIIRGSAVNNDGRASGMLMAPAVDGQVELLREAYRRAGVGLGEVAYIEAHGTGTSIGDAVELEALATVFGAARPAGRPLLVGSVKSNIGHAEGAAGMAGLIKTVLCLEGRTIVPSLHLQRPNTVLEGLSDRLAVPTVATALPEPATTVYAGVSSFGIAGTNAHVVLASSDHAALAAADDRPHLLTLSARTPAAVRDLAQQWIEELARSEVPVRDLAYSSAVRRDHFEYRLAVIGTSRRELLDALRAFLDGKSTAAVRTGADVAPRPLKVVFVFPGQGSQWIGMGRGLLAQEPVFAAALRRCDEAIAAETGWSVTELISDGPAERFEQVEVIQPAIWAIQVALAALWQSWGISPDTVVGHSMGEVAAAHVAGVLSVRDAAMIICRRSKLVKARAECGAMATVELDGERAEQAIAEHVGTVSVAAYNSPTSSVISGDAAAVSAILTDLTARDVFGALIRVDFASHSPHMDPLLPELLAALAELQPRTGTVTLRSTVTGEVIDGSAMRAAYWADNLRAPVRFADAVAAEAAGPGDSAFIEISPHPVLLPALRAQVTGAGLAVGSTRRGRDERTTLLDSLAELYTAGCFPVRKELFGTAATYVPIPSYPWQHRRFWLDSPTKVPPFATTAESEPTHERPATHECVLGQAETAANGQRVWETDISQARYPFLVDHRIRGAIVVPGAFLLAMLGEAADQVCPSAVISGVSFEQALFLLTPPTGTVQATGPAVRLRTVLTGEDGGWSATMHSRTAPDQEWTPHLSARIEPSPTTGSAESRSPSGAANPHTQAGTTHAGSDFYQQLADSGNSYGPAFQAVRSLRHDDGRCAAELCVTTDTPDFFSRYVAQLDASVQPLAVLLPNCASASQAPFVLVSVARLVRHRRSTTSLTAHVTRTRSAAASVTGDVDILDADGHLVAELVGVTLARLGPPAGEPAPSSVSGRHLAVNSRAAVRSVTDWLHTTDWATIPARPQRPGPTGWWLVLADAHGVAVRLRRRLVDAGNTVQLLEASEIDVVSPTALRWTLSRIFADQDGPCQGIIHLWSLNVPRPDNDLAAALTTAQQLGIWSPIALVQALTDIAGARSTPVLLVTQSSQAADGQLSNPLQAPIWGLGRVLAAEHPNHRIRLIDLPDTDDETCADLLLSETAHLDGEPAIAIRDSRLTPRLVPLAASSVLSPPDGARRVPTEGSPGADQVELAPDLPPPATGSALWEGSATVTAVGAGVTGLAVGQRVIAVAAVPTGDRDHLVIPSCLAHPLNVSVTSAQAATMPLAFLGAYRALITLGRLGEGDSVLLHDATTPTALAAVQIAQWKGARLYASAATEAQRDALRLLGVSHVYDPRSATLNADVRRDSAGQGVNIILACSAGAPPLGDQLPLHPLGHLVRLIDDSTGPLPDSSAGTRSRHRVNATELARGHPEIAGAILKKVFRQARRGVLRPLPHLAFPGGAARDTGTGRRHGSDRSVRVRGDGSYLITGGVGGLGRVVARHLVERGARHLLLTGRSAPDPSIRDFVHELASSGCTADYRAVDVADEAAMRQTLAEYAGPPLRGVIHAAGVMRPRPSFDLDLSEVATMLRPKLQGGWVLHQTMAGQDLDFFVLFSSIASFFPLPFLGAYAAANSALDALAIHRRSQGLPATSVGWGFWDEVGLAVRLWKTEGRDLMPNGWHAITPAEGVAVFEAILSTEVPHVGVLPVDWQVWAATYPYAARAVNCGDAVASPVAASHVPAPRAASTVVTTDHRLHCLTTITNQVADTLGIPASEVSIRQPLNKMGVDSLMGAEIQQRVRHSIGAAPALTTILRGGSITDLAAQVAAQLDSSLDL